MWKISGFIGISGLSLARMFAVTRKELIQLLRDRLTFGMVVGIPIILLVLFGYAIDGDPKHLKAGIVDNDYSASSRAIVLALQNSGYYDIVNSSLTPQQGDSLLSSGGLQFVVTFPKNFERDIYRRSSPTVLVEVDATDPSAGANAISALNGIASNALINSKVNIRLQVGIAQPFSFRLHRLYNPDGITQNNIIPGLMGVILTITMIMMTSLAVTRELERGTMENLLATPVTSFEVLLGKILPYILIGYLQVFLILLASRFLFDVPFVGKLLLLMVCVLFFILANLTVGICISSVVKNQMQAMQMTYFFFLPSMLLSGFMFPFQGMPVWARNLGELLPLTHFLRIIRGIMLKGNIFSDVWSDVYPLIIFSVLVFILGIKSYRKTLD